MASLTLLSPDLAGVFADIDADGFGHEIELVRQHGHSFLVVPGDLFFAAASRAWS